MVRGFAEQGLWALWMRSGDKAIDALMTKGVDQMRARDFKAAIATFSQVIKRTPAFAEGWNKRATVYYLAGEYRKSIADCDEVVRRNPHHFGAIAGYGQNYFELKQYDKAIRYWKRALEENPTMVTIEMNIDGAQEMLEEQRRRSA
jgi:tetratricopeptide (TPR) repeat protein